MPVKKPATIQPKLRLKADLHQRLKQAAKRSHRTLNQEMVYRLQQSFEQDAAAALLEQAKGTLGQVRGLLDYATQSRGDRRT